MDQAKTGAERAPHASAQTSLSARSPNFPVRCAMDHRTRVGQASCLSPVGVVPSGPRRRRETSSNQQPRKSSLCVITPASLREIREIRGPFPPRRASSAPCFLPPDLRARFVLQCTSLYSGYANLLRLQRFTLQRFVASTVQLLRLRLRRAVCSVVAPFRGSIPTYPTDP